MNQFNIGDTVKVVGNDTLDFPPTGSVCKITEAYYDEGEGDWFMIEMSPGNSGLAGSWDLELISKAE